MKKVLFVATVTKHINSFHIPYLKWFKEEGYEVHVASNGNEPIEYCDKHYNLPFERFPLRKNNIKTYRELKKIINENKYEIIHCHTPVGGVLTRLAAKKARKKGTRVIYTAHGFHFYKGAPLLNWLIYYPIEKWMSKYTDTLITINREDYELAKNKFKKCKQMKLVNGVGLDTVRLDIEISEQEQEELKKNLGIEKNNIVLTYIAEINKNKNQQLLIKTVEQLEKQGENEYVLLLVGNGKLKEIYEKYVKDKHLENNIKFLGQRNDIAKILKITDIYVASSLREGLPVNILEAMYMGLPLIVTNNRGHRELIENSKNGFLINNDSKELENRIKTIVESKKLAEKFAKQNNERIKKYLLKNILMKMEKIY